MKKRVCSCFLIFFIFLMAFPGHAFAAGNTKWVEITQEGQVVDSITLQGKTVQALYAPYMTFGSVKKENGEIGYYYNGNTTYCCAAFVKRFYSQVYGLNVFNLIPGGKPTSSVSFQETKTPVVGDIVSANNGSHWAIVKNVNGDGTVTLIEQNHWMEAAPNRVHAAVGYTINISDTTYRFYRMGGGSPNNGNAAASTSRYATVTTSSAQSITQTSAILYGSAKSTGGRITSCGMELGTSKSNMTKLGSDTISTYSTSMWYSTSKYGRTLQPGTTYYYRAYAVVGNATYYGDTRSFTTPASSTEQLAGISLDKSSLSMKDNVCVQLTATTTPSGQPVSWTSSNPSVAAVSGSGSVTGLKAGTAKITASTTYGGKTYTASCQVTVTASIQAGISVNRSSVSLKDGETVQLSAMTDPVGQTVTYSSSDTDVAVVGQTNGTVMGINEGTATITAKMTYNGTAYTAKCVVTVTPSVEKAGITLSRTSMTLADNASSILAATTVPNNRSVTWSSSDPAVATVNSSGKVSGVSAGTATITASMQYNGSVYRAACTVTVTGSQEAKLTAPKLTLSSNTISEGDDFTASWTSAGASAKYYISYTGQLSDGTVAAGNWSDTQALSDRLSNHNGKWEAGTYRILVVAYNNSGSVYSNEVTLTVKAKNNVSISWTADYSRFSIGSTNATIAVTGTVSGASTANVSTVGIYLYDASGNCIASKSEAVSFSSAYDYFHVWYDVNNSLGCTLSGGTTYKAKFYAVIDGITYTSPAFKFTTAY